MAAPTFQVNFVLTSKLPLFGAVSSMVEEEIIKSLETIVWPASKGELDKNVADWGNKPTFEHTINISKGRVDFAIGVKMDKAGEIYTWVDKGTGLEGARKSKYPIDPKSPNVTFLRFVTPYSPKTFPPTQLRYSPTGAKVINYRKHVDHPGIQARKFTEKAFAKFNDKKSIKGFRNAVILAFVLGYAKAGIKVIKGIFGG